MTAAAEFLSHRYGSLFPPTVVMAGDADKIVDYGQAQRLHGEVAGSRLEVFNGGSHMIHYLDPERFVQGIEAAREMATGTSERI
jgi:pimeloyl-ACP methyl ester carboxylesterase